jgi:catechol 2,3-dioxygenase-like lactoylglutathione lyase family enzyme
MSAGAWQKQLDAITLFVEDLPRARAFYADVFEQPLIFEDASSAVFKFGDTMINLLASPEGDDLIAPAAVAGAGTGSRCQLSIFVDDVDTVCAELAAKGVELVNGPIDRAWGMRTACFADPAGHLWEVAQDLDASTATR